MTPRHPGTITYVDRAANTERQLPVTEVPEALRFAPNLQGTLVPVVRVVAEVAGAQRFIKEFGPAGEFLRETILRA